MINAHYMVSVRPTFSVTHHLRRRPMAPALGVLLAVCSIGGVARAESAADATCRSRVGKSIEGLVSGDPQAATANFDPSLERHLGASVLQVWSRIQTQGGGYVRHSPPEWRMLAGKRYLVTSFVLPRHSVDAVSACDAEGRIYVYEWVVMPQVASNPMVVQAMESDGVRTRALKVESLYGPLAATLTLPPGAGPFPAVLLVAGSGPNDQDETVGEAKPFRDIAIDLAAAGVASLRFDKRTHAYPLESAVSDDMTIDDEVTDDALAALALLRRQRAIDTNRIFLLGHSLGAMIAPRIAARGRGIAGAILLAAPAQPLLDVLTRQVQALGEQHGLPKETLIAQMQAMRAEHSMLERADGKHLPAGRFMGAPQSYWFSLRAYDPVDAMARVPLPVLFMQGDKDIQVPAGENLPRWKARFASQPGVTFKEYPRLDHRFIVPEEGRAPRVDPQVGRDIAAWIHARRPSKGG